uniref:DNA topoisomerase n=1 Tax=Oncorhynchus tshawytscha TaxID=74940 RepID=A0AAZ3P0U6_ONCTS
CLVIYQICMEDPIATVTSVTSKPKSKWRPLPLDTVEMEKLVSRKLRIGAKETMKIAEKLYTQGLISYPRTETNLFPKDLALGPLVEHQTHSPSWGAFARGVMEQPGGPNPRQGTKTDQAHPPIHPIKYTNTLQGNEQRVYEFIVRHFLACVSLDAVGQETVVEVEMAHERFSANGLMIIRRNYLDVYPYDRWSTKVIPVYEQGSQFQPSAIEMLDGQTSPPQLLTEADLISLMEKHGIGTDATHADHIETIKSRMYVGLTADQRFLPGELGMGLVEGRYWRKGEMSKPHLRAELEADLKLVSEGGRTLSVLRHHIHKYKTVFVLFRKLDEALSIYLGAAQEFSESEQQDMEMPLPVRKCPQWGGTWKYLSCVGYPECKCSVWFPDTVLEVNRDESVCPTCQPRPVHMLKFRRGSLPPMMPLEFVGCIGGCDETLREVLNLKYLRMGRGDTATNQPRPRPAPRPDPLSPQAPRPDPRGGDITVCNCGSEAVLLTVRKDGPNQGRQFYKCSSGGCNFFLWTDQPHQPRDLRGEVVCNCSEPAVQRTVQKEGPNKGKVFHTCGKPRDQQCGFFLWADENIPPPGNETHATGGRGGERLGRRSPPPPNPATRKPRTCGICHMPGHTRVTCPQR